MIKPHTKNREWKWQKFSTENYGVTPSEFSEKTYLGSIILHPSQIDHQFWRQNTIFFSGIFKNSLTSMYPFFNRHIKSHWRMCSIKMWELSKKEAEDPRRERQAIPKTIREANLRKIAEYRFIYIYIYIYSFSDSFPL